MNRHQRRAEDALRKERIARANAELQRDILGASRAFDTAFQAEIADELARDGQGRAVTCSAGCAHCCNQAVFMSFGEARAIATRYPAAAKAALPEFERQLVLQRELGLPQGQRTLEAADKDPEREAFLARWFLAKIPCALLDKKTQRCTVYEARPLGCRALAVVTPPAKCEAVTAETPVEERPVGFEQKEAYELARGQHMAATHRRFGRVLMGLMPQMMQWAINHSDESYDRARAEAQR